MTYLAPQCECNPAICCPRSVVSGFFTGLGIYPCSDAMKKGGGDLVHLFFQGNCKQVLLHEPEIFLAIELLFNQCWDCQGTATR